MLRVGTSLAGDSNQSSMSVLASSNDKNEMVQEAQRTVGSMFSWTDFGRLGNRMSIGQSLLMHNQRHVQPFI